MKKIIIKNAMALVALAIAGTTLMSFGLSNMENQWFAVQNDGTIESAPLTAPPSGDCQINLPAPTCAVELPSDHSYENISEVPTNARKAGKRN